MFDRWAKRPTPPKGFFPVIDFPGDIAVFDFSQEREYADMTLVHPWGWGKYLERRPSVYVTELFRAHGEEPREIHMGVDLFAPVGTEIRAFTDAVILFQGYNSAAGDYGNVLVTESRVAGVPIYALYGHLNQNSIRLHELGTSLKGGELLGYVGDRHENGGYPPHLHFQLSFLRPNTHDLQGAVAQSELAQARLIYPDPGLVLGFN